ncbi:MAG: heavy-metal-associated domain-containing protein [Evtepia gabavorous]
MTCSACPLMEKAVSRLDGVQKAEVSLMTNSMTVSTTRTSSPPAASSTPSSTRAMGPPCLRQPPSRPPLPGPRPVWRKSSPP